MILHFTVFLITQMQSWWAEAFESECKDLLFNHFQSGECFIC